MTYISRFLGDLVSLTSVAYTKINDTFISKCDDVFFPGLNQNQNLSLSKYLTNTFNYGDNTNLSTPQIFQTVLISSPEHDNYIINIDTQASHVLLSAPPVSPSVMNTASMSSLPTNVQSPRSTTAMVMLKCATPVLLSNATRNATLLNESISIEKINHKTSTNM